MPSRPMRVCLNCGAEHFPTRKGRCKRCDDYLRMYQVERPEQVYAPHSKACSRCGAASHEALGLCNPCYQWRRAHGTPRPYEHIYRKPLAQMGVRRCARCRELRHFTEFDATTAGGTRLQGECRPCQRIRQGEHRRANAAQPIAKECDYCSEGFMAPPQAPFARFCSKYCNHRYWVEHNPEARREHYRRRYAAIRGATTTHIVRREEVFARDGWRCRLCGKNVDPKLKFPHPMSATVDHIVPVSKGGAHSPENVQLAHFRCNCSKKDRSAGEQLLLVG